MPQIPFGNDPAKIEKYLCFWNREDVKRPLVGFSLVGWFPMEEFAICQHWETAEFLTPEMVEPRDFMDDHVRLAREGEVVDDDMIRGACPTQVTVPFQINNDAIGLPVADMVPYFQKVQKAGRSLLIRGAFTPEEMRLLMDTLTPRGLFLNIMVKEMEEVDALRPILRM
ncbi:MAG: hypothetical protein AB1Z31_07710 [Desulfobacterales bacterium]|jgi:hypothetical protein